MPAILPQRGRGLASPTLLSAGAGWTGRRGADTGRGHGSRRPPYSPLPCRGNGSADIGFPGPPQYAEKGVRLADLVLVKVTQESETAVVVIVDALTT
ncbi:hypothetical protein [Streptomyces sp. NPDC018693]|uniref:hypothetical protein n=1 Tax=unclassified Streptomyces TaxID=2593676 RepID=UPI0037A9E264